MLIQWFPGHMAKAQRLIKEQLKAIDVVVELRDARVPASSENPLLRELIQTKPRILLLNKADLADPKISAQWQQYFAKRGITTLLIDSTSKSSRKRLIQEIRQAAAPVLERWKRRGIRARSVRTMILGIPNVGKSTLINTLAKSYIAHTANRPGKTRGQQWVKLADGVELMDTPGVLWPKFEDPVVGQKLAATGAITDEVFDAEDVVRNLLTYIDENYPGALMERYGIQTESGTPDEWLTEIAKKRGALLPKGEYDHHKARQFVLGDFRQLRLGKISLETPPAEASQNG